MAGRAAVLVDCDGTLVETNYLHALAWSRALRKLGTWAPMNALHRLVGMGGEHLVPKLLGHELDGVDDAHDHHYEDLKVIGAGDAVDAVVHADDVSSSKPSPEIFERARDKCGIDPNRVAVVGDSIWNVRAARAARMRDRCGVVRSASGR